MPSRTSSLLLELTECFPNKIRSLSEHSDSYSESKRKAFCPVWSRYNSIYVIILAVFEHIYMYVQLNLWLSKHIFGKCTQSQPSHWWVFRFTFGNPVIFNCYFTSWLILLVARRVYRHTHVRQYLHFLIKRENIKDPLQWKFKANGGYVLAHLQLVHFKMYALFFGFCSWLIEDFRLASLV